MVRRTTRTLVLVATLLLVFPAAALAYDLEVRGPVTAGTERVDIRVGFATDEAQPQRLRVRVAGEDRDRVVAECAQGCDPQTFGGHSIFRLPIQARGGGFGTLTNRFPNGPVPLDIQGERERLGRTDRFDVGRAEVVLDVPGSAVGSLSIAVSGEEVRLTWDVAPEAGISGYRVERTSGSSGSTQVTTTSGTSATDRPGPGEHEYRVVTVRPKAGDGSHETASGAVTAVVERPEASSAGDVGGDEGRDGGGAGGAADGGASDGGTSSDGPDDGADAEGPSSSRATAPGLDADPSADGDDQAAEAPRTARDRDRLRTDRAPSVASDRGGFGTPELPRVGDIFRGELDFDRDGDGDPDGDLDDEVVLSAPGGGFGSFLGAGEEAERIAVPIAGGLLLTAIGLHLWRWLKVPLT